MVGAVRAVLATLLIGGLTGCASVPLTSLPRLATLDPKSLDPAQIEAAIRVPDAIRVTKTGFRYEIVNKATGERLGDVYTLSPIQAAPTPALAREGRAGMKLLRFRLSPQQASALAAARDRALRWPEAKKKEERELTLAVNASFCLEPNANPFRELKVTIYLRDSQSRDFFTLVSETPLKLDGLTRCAA